MTNKKNVIGASLLVYFICIVFLITLIPFDFKSPENIEISWRLESGITMVANIFLFIPIGFLFALTQNSNKAPFCFQALGFGLLLSLFIEIAQVFVHGRTSSVIDMLTNGFGAWAGAISVGYFRNKLSENRTARLFSFELPLMNIVYLLIPLIWLNCMATGDEAARLWILVLPGLFGTGVLSLIYVHRFRGLNQYSLNKFSFLVLTWFIIASIPALINFPIQVATFGICACLITQIFVRFLQKNHISEKRFELPTLKKLFPLFIIYLLLLTLWPTTLALQNWQSHYHLFEFAFNKRVVFTFRFIEIIAAFTLLGYIMAEMRGRRKESIFETFGWIYLIALCASVLMEILRSFPPPFTFNVFEMALLIGASLYGAFIYRLQMKAIQAKKGAVENSRVVWEMPAI